MLNAQKSRITWQAKQPLRQVKDEEVGGGSFVKPPITAAFYLYTQENVLLQSLD